MNLETRLTGDPIMIRASLLLATSLSLIGCGTQHHAVYEHHEAPPAYEEEHVEHDEHGYDDGPEHHEPRYTESEVDVDVDVEVEVEHDHSHPSDYEDTGYSGFTDCGDFLAGGAFSNRSGNQCQPNQYCADTTFSRCAIGCLSDVNCDSPSRCVKSRGAQIGTCN